mgnify:CR=1 FL=1
MEDQLFNFEILKAADSSLWREYQEKKSKYKTLKIASPRVPTCADLFELANEWKTFIKTGVKPTST